MRVFRTADELLAAVGDDLGTSDEVLVDQARIDAFAEVTGDRQWIHVDAQRAAEGPFGSTVAHGYLTLSLVPALVATVVDYTGWRVRINYGANKIRFPGTVPVDSRVRAAVRLVEVSPSGAAGERLVVTTTVTVAVIGPGGTPAERPGLVAEIVTLLAEPVEP